MVGRGSYGDMFPLYAIAMVLQKRGHTVSIATDSAHKGVTASLGLQLIELDGLDAVVSSSPMSLLGQKIELLRDLAVRNIAKEVELLLAAAQDADLIVGNQLAYGASIVRKILQKPWVYCAASPLALPSSQNPPLFPYLHGLQQLFLDYPAMQRAFLGLAKGVSSLMMKPLLWQQRKMGVLDDAHPRFEGIYSRHLNLLAVSPQLVAHAADWPDPTVVSGFTWFEPSFMRNAEKLSKLHAFLDNGSPPIVFALGGNSRTRPGRFFLESIKACEHLGVRSIIVAAERFHGELPESAKTLVTGYLPYADVFPRAAAVVHSGGIGTIGWSLRYALPSLLRPTGLDQFDNASRVSRKGYAAILRQGDYRAPVIAEALSRLLDDSAMRGRLENCSATLQTEDGALEAVSRIESLLP